MAARPTKRSVDERFDKKTTKGNATPSKAGASNRKDEFYPRSAFSEISSSEITFTKTSSSSPGRRSPSPFSKKNEATQIASTQKCQERGRSM